MVLDHEHEHTSRWAMPVSIAGKIGCNKAHQTASMGLVYVGTRQRAQVIGLTTDMAAKLKTLGWENRELRQANEILAQGQRRFARAGGARPPILAMIAFIDDHRGAYGVEPICKCAADCSIHLHGAHAAKRAEPAKLSPRPKQDAIRKIEISRVFAENYDVYGVRKVCRQLRRQGEDIARSTVD